jgi:hypothetical protein
LAAPPTAPTYSEALILLSESARASRVAAQIALVRALRPEGAQESLDSEIGRLLSD